MNRKKSKTVPALLAVLVSAALLGGCGSGTGEVPPASGTVTGATAVGIDACAGCHTVQTAAWLMSRHANAEGGLNSAGTPTLGQVATCTKNCHDPNGDSANILAAGYLGAARPIVGCEACHGEGSLHNGSGPISLLSNTTGTVLGGTVTVSGQFVMCTNCHELLDTSGTATVTAAHEAGGAEAASASGNQYIIADTHFATPGDWSGVGAANLQPATGYAMGSGDAPGFDNERVCVNCHNPHKPATRNREWALSAHADKNFENLNSLGTGYFSGAWAHYNWSCDGSSIVSCSTSTTNPAGPHSDKRPCQRCHTTTGFVAYANALRSGDTQRAHDINNGAYSLVTFTTGFKPEMLKCNGCHTDNNGALRNPGPITANYDYPVPLAAGAKPSALASHTYPNLAGSNVCMTCHVGRETGETIKGLNDPALLAAGTIAAFNFGNGSFVNSHYLTAGGQIFTATGYEFDGRPYNNISEYRHDKIGTKATQEMWPYADTGSNGPCIGCHMSRPNKNGNHLFLPVSRSTTIIGEVTGVASEVCQKCHGVSNTPILELIKIRKPLFKGALEALKDEIQSKLGYYFFPYSPYWYRSSSYTDPKTVCTDNIPVRNWQTGGTEKAPVTNFPYDPYNSACCTYKGNANGIVGTGQNNMGAAFNFNLLEHDPGAYAHNSVYAKRLLYDSIDWVDDGIMNYSVAGTLIGLGNTEAIEYLLMGENNDATDRP
jgi:hypothetical protein